LVAEFFELVRGGVAFAIPKRIEQTDQRRALPGVIVQVEQLESGEARRAEVGFDFLLVTFELEPARGLRKIF